MPDTLPPVIESELNRIAERMATLLEAIPPQVALSALLALGEKICLHRDKLRTGALVTESVGREQLRVQNGDAPEAVDVPPEVIAEAHRTFDEKEIADAIREIREGRGLRLDDFLPDLEKGQHTPGDSPRV